MTSTASNVPHRTLSVEDEELPPAYTPAPDVQQGESTLEYGPSRPHQRPPPRPAPAPIPVPTPPASTHPVSPHSTGSSTQRLGSLWDQLTGQLQEFANIANDRVGRMSSPHRYGSSYPTPGGWSSYPGAHAQASPYPSPQGPPPFPPRAAGGAGRPAPPPQHPASHGHSQSASNLSQPRREAENRRASSDFVRDFYAAGDSVPPELVSSGENRGAGPSSNPNVPGKPTTEPTPGHPLLRDGKLLVYPKGYECEKCHNIGYKLPSMKPCKRCWPKYGKPFSGPLAYSFGDPNASNATNFQRPLPPRQRPPPPPRPSYGSSSFPSSVFRAPLVSPSYRPQTVVIPGHGHGYPHAAAPGRPPAGSVVYNAGDPRIGGNRCWRCHGSGTISLLIIDREQCPVCGGIGRTFT
ncbi:hypothetical protein CC2G_010921 [Coprinopsis cinerea AmutBmut pab1-1]|nr:hypothetical protein CC2G_010921 [Coprinopsis cinerea AmutBmut pab1-1]